ncbi:MAG: carboxypeptidase-like regulatory domain-containing protein [Flavobacteriaceae bacterium]|nr:carboxypeptidase-like regulatory domain-containing protein [Flavobacteriaceae bacterium]
MISLSCFSQEKELKGKIINGENLEGIHILNTRAKKFTITNEKGEFYIDAQLNDTIYFNSLVYKTQGFQVTQQMIDNEAIAVALEEDVNQLKEVTVGRKLTGNINEDIKQVTIKDTINFADVGIPGFEGVPEEKIVPVVPSIGFGAVMDIEALYKHITGYYKKLKLGRKWDKQDKTIIKVYDLYGHDFFLDTYAINEEKIYEFLLACVEEDAFVENFKNENYELILKVFKAQSVNFKE